MNEENEHYSQIIALSETTKILPKQLGGGVMEITYKVNKE
jgi:hypothetical protein